jgi:type II secretion system protein F
MPHFSYKATNNDGHVVEGVIEASEEGVVVKQLQNLNLIPITIVPEKGEVKVSFALLGIAKRVSVQELLLFTREIASLLKAGVPLERSLKILIKLSEKQYFASVLTKVFDDIVGGSSLADAMANHPKVFSRLYVSMVRSGEASGALDTILEKLTDFLERTQELRGYVLSAIIYPALLTVVSVFSIIILLVFVVPKFASTFTDIGIPLPLSMVVLITISHFIRGFWWLGILLLLASFFSWRFYCKTPSGLLVWDGFKLRLPLLGGLIKRIEVARLSRTLGTILKGGVPILQSLSIVREVVGNTVIAGEVDELYRSVKRGEGIANSLKGKSVIPTLAVEMISVGEETGRLPETLVDIADTFDRQVKERVKHLLALLEPGLILIVGLLVGTVVISMLLAIFSMNDMPF